MSFRRPLAWLFAIPLLLALAAVLGTCVPRPLWPAERETAASASTQRILVLSGPIHTDIAIPLDAETLALFPFLEESGMPVTHPNARWLVFGWGGRAFYIETPTWSQLKPMPLIKGLTIDASVMHTDLAGEIVEPSENIAGFDLDRAAYGRLLSFIKASFRPQDGRIAAIPDAGYGPNDRFFEAHGWFSAAFGCNTWTAQALRQAGLRTGWWNPLPVLLTTSLGLYN